jgi:3',5'-cyclic AMP phosphodiesterase CpdA
MPPLMFGIVGETSDGDQVYKQILDKVVKDGNAFLIHTGNMVSDGSRDPFEAFQEWMADFPLPFYPVPGDQDRGDDDTLANYVEWSGAPATHYSLDVEAVHLTMANNATGHLSDAELAWIDSDLAATDLPIKIVCMHYPPFDPDGTSDILQSGNEAFMALMEKHSVDYVFTGHIRAYSQEERDGTVYVVSGGGGAPLQDDGHPQAFYHYVQVIVEGTEVRIQVVRVD